MPAVNTQSPSELQNRVKQYNEQKNWRGVYEVVGSINNLESANCEIWNNPKLLSDIGFAVGKLAETSKVQMLPKEKETFLAQQKQYRNETEKLRNRCIALAPENPTYLANLGYFHYRNISELSEGARRDANIWRDIEECIKCYDECLRIAPKRIVEHYRLGKVLTEKIPNIVLWGKQFQNLTLQKRQEKVSKHFQEGIEHLEQVEKLWTQLSLDNYNEEQQKKRTRKEFIKALYALGGAYLELAEGSDLDLAALAIEGNGDFKPRAFITDSHYIDKSVRYYIKCILVDAELDASIKKNPDEILKAASQHGQEDAVYKLYSLGKALLCLYIYLWGQGKTDDTALASKLEYAEKFLQKAMHTPYSKDISRQNKYFVAERLSRLYMTQRQYDKAISVIEEYRKQNRRKYEQLDEYVLQTLMTAYSLNKDHHKVVEISESCMNLRNTKRLWLTSYLVGCSLLRNGEFEEAQKYIQEEEQMAREQGKENIDSIFVARGIAIEKSGNNSDAAECFKQAISLNSHNVTAKKRLEKIEKQTASITTPPSPKIILPNNLTPHREAPHTL